MDFAKKFLGRLEADGDLHARFTDVRTDLDRLFSVKSAKDLLEHGLAFVIDVLALLLEGILAITNALIDGLLTVLADLLDLLFDDDSGLLTRPLHIPVLSALYRTAIGEDLTVLNLLMLVLAIPVTILYRVVSGHYPSRDLPSTGQLQAASSRMVLRNLFGLLATATLVVGGILNTILDSQAEPLKGSEPAGEGGEEGSSVLAVVALCAGIVLQGVTEPNVAASAPEEPDWIVWGVGFGPLAIAAVALVVSKWVPGAGEGADFAASVVLALCSLAILIAASVGLGEKDRIVPDDAIAFASLVLLSVPGMANPIKYGGDLPKLIVCCLDVLGTIGASACQAVVTLTSWKDSMTQAATP